MQAADQPPQIAAQTAEQLPFAPLPRPLAAAVPGAPPPAYAPGMPPPLSPEVVDAASRSQGGAPTPFDVEEPRGALEKFGRGAQRAMPLISDIMRGAAAGRQTNDPFIAFAEGERASRMLPYEMLEAEMGARKSQADIEKIFSDIDKGQAETDKARQEAALMQPEFESEAEARQAKSESDLANAALADERRRSEAYLREYKGDREKAAARLDDARAVKARLEAEIAERLEAGGFNAQEAKLKARKLAAEALRAEEQAKYYGSQAGSVGDRTAVDRTRADAYMIQAKAAERSAEARMMEAQATGDPVKILEGIGEVTTHMQRALSSVDENAIMNDPTLKEQARQEVIQRFQPILDKLHEAYQSSSSSSSRADPNDPMGIL